MIMYCLLSPVEQVVDTTLLPILQLPSVFGVDVSEVQTDGDAVVGILTHLLGQQVIGTTDLKGKGEGSTNIIYLSPLIIISY